MTRASFARFLLVLAAVLSIAPISYANNTSQTLPFVQRWTNTGLITTDDNWSGVPGIIGYRGDGLAGSTGVNPQTILGEGTLVVDVNANRTDPNTFITGGVTEFELGDPVVALQGSGTARAPYLQFHIDTTGWNNINVSYNLRDIDGSADNSVQPFALQFRVGSTGNFTNVPAGFVADASSGGTATLVTAVNVTLPVAADNKPLVQIRVITTDAAGSDEWVGIDDMTITGSGGPTAPSGVGAANPNSVVIGGSTLLTVAVTPGTNPMSTGLAVAADLTAIGGLNNQSFFDDATHGDTTAGDNVFSFSATIGAAATGGAKTLVATITDAETRSATANISLTVLAPTNPSGTGTANPNSVQPGDSTLLTVNVTPGANPTSTGISVSADLSSIGGSSSQLFSGSGNTFTFSTTVAINTSAGGKTLSVTISDAEGRTGSTTISLNIEQPPPPIDHVVMSQIYGGGGNTNATFQNDYVELFNPSNVSFDLAGWTLAYASAAGSSWTNNQPLGGVIAPGEYFLISLATGGAVGAPLPPANITGEINMSATTGKIALVSNGIPLSGPCPVGNDPDIVDFVGYGSGATCREGTNNAPAPSNTTALFRRSGGFLDTNQNSTDFLTGVPSPRQTTPIQEIGPSVFSSDPIAAGSNAPRDASITINFTEPVNVSGAWYDITCAVTGPHNSATTANFALGKSWVITPNTNFMPDEQCTVTVFKDFVHDQDLDDSAPNTDTLPADYIFTFSVATGTAPPFPAAVHLTMGNPSGAEDDTAVPNNYLMMKPEFALSYNRDRGTPNWVSWHLSDEWVGTLTRVDTFRADPAVPPDWYRVQASDFFASGFDRGHMTPNADRDKETSIPINQATFLMTNMLPQAPDNNQGPWANLENFLRTLLPASEIYIVAGGAGTGGTGSNGGVTNTVADGHVTVPAWTWKVALILNKADGDDLAGVMAESQTLAVIMPNTQGIRNNDWMSFLTTVDAVETLTGYDFFANVNDPVENAIEAGVNGVNPPGVANQSATTDEDEAAAVTLNAASPHNNPLTYTIVGNPSHGVLSGSGNSRTYTPAPDFNGTDTFTFRVNDGLRDSNIGTVTLTVLEVNDAPVAADDTASATEDQTATFAASSLTTNDTNGPANESGQTLTLTGVNATADTHGSVSLAGGQITYVPDANFNGAARFTYQVCDNGVTRGLSDPLCSTATVNVSVASVNDDPTIAAIPDQTVFLGNTLTFTAAGSDIDVPAQTLIYSLAGAFPPSATILSAGVFTWTPSGADAGFSFTFNVVVSDGVGSASTSVKVTVVDNAPPVISPLVLSLTQLWPADHRMVDITVSYTATDMSATAPACTLRVSSSEPVDGTGSGDTAPDWEIVDAHKVRLRAERMGSGNGRTYTVTAVCADRFLNVSQSTASVFVPKSPGK